MRKSKFQGFTLVEILLVIGLMSAIIALSAPLLTNFVGKNSVAVARQVAVSSLQRAQILSRKMSHDEGWGVNISTGLITVYKGSQFATRDPIYDEVTSISTEVLISGDTDVIFTKFDGKPLSPVSLNLSDGNNDSYVVTVNSAGVIDY